MRNFVNGLFFSCYCCSLWFYLFILVLEIPFAIVTFSFVSY